VCICGGWAVSSELFVVCICVCGGCVCGVRADEKNTIGRPERIGELGYTAITLDGTKA